MRVGTVFGAGAAGVRVGEDNPAADEEDNDVDEDTDADVEAEDTEEEEGAELAEHCANSAVVSDFHFLMKPHIGFQVGR